MTSPSQSIIKVLNISGRVQGVGFRMNMCSAARELGITGWVRNRCDGTVEALVAGTPEAVDSIIMWARRGPPKAVVSNVEIAEGNGDYATFDMLPTE